MLACFAEVWQETIRGTVLLSPEESRCARSSAASRNEAVKVAGDDAGTSLNGRFTADIGKVAPGQARFAALTPQARRLLWISSRRGRPRRWRRLLP